MMRCSFFVLTFSLSLVVKVVAEARSIDETKNDESSSSSSSSFSAHRQSLRRSLAYDPQPEPRVIGGNDADEDRYPYYVALMEKDEFFIVCGGTLIAPDIVLTAAHCFSKDLKFAVIGKYARRDSDTDILEKREIDKTFINPDFDYVDVLFDQMLITLKSPSTFPYLKHVNLDANLPAVGGGDITTIGLGATSLTGDRPDVLQVATGRYVPNDECASYKDQDEDYSNIVEPDHMCVADNGGQCYGDSGGPQLLLGATADEDIQVGIVSWGVDCGTDLFPSVGSRTSASTFIKDKTCELSSNPPSILCADSPVVPDNPGPTLPAGEGPTEVPQVVINPETSGCVFLLQPCPDDAACCSKNCLNGFCRTSASSSRQSLADNRGGAAGAANRPGGG